jgi:hypothetical protein
MYQEKQPGCTKESKQVTKMEVKTPYEQWLQDFEMTLRGGNYNDKLNVGRQHRARGTLI